jgi:site-specific DNA recombinase
MTAPGPSPAARGRKRRRPVPSFGGASAGPRRVAVYLRRSTDDEHQPFSISAQQTAVTAYVTTQPGWTLTATYTDDASGATTSRPGLQQALRAARARRFDVLLVYRVDRFSRRLSDLLHLLAELDEAGVAFASATEPFDTSTSIGRMLVQLLGVFAEFERETIIDRVTKGMATKAAKGKWPGGQRPYGYRADPGTSKLTPNPEEAPHLREIFRLYTEERLGTRAVAGVHRSYSCKPTSISSLSTARTLPGLASPSLLSRSTPPGSASSTRCCGAGGISTRTLLGAQRHRHVGTRSLALTSTSTPRPSLRQSRPGCRS